MPQIDLTADEITTLKRGLGKEINEIRSYESATDQFPVGVKQAFASARVDLRALFDKLNDAT